MHLKGAVSACGGRTTPFMSVKGVTHVIAENLSAIKTDKAMKVLCGSLGHSALYLFALYDISAGQERDRCTVVSMRVGQAT